jgi:hypothetical protein
MPRSHTTLISGILSLTVHCKVTMLFFLTPMQLVRSRMVVFHSSDGFASLKTLLRQI